MKRLAVPWCARGDAGFTLAEVLTVIVVLGVLSATAMHVGTGWIEQWQVSTRRQDLLNEASVAMNRMVREIRNIRDRSAVSTATQTQLVFTDVGGNVADFNYAPDAQTLTRNYTPFGGVTGGDQTLAANVTNFTLTYFRLNQTLATANQLVELNGANDELVVFTGGSYTNIRLVRIEMSITRDGTTVTLRTAVAPVNLQME